MILDRQLYKIELQNKKFEKSYVSVFTDKVKKQLHISDKEIHYFVFQDNIINNAYNPKMDKINILLKNNTIRDITNAVDTFNIKALATPVKKWFLCYPKQGKV